ncbi:Uncharacterized protein HZ326_18789 [Fusarium oxysporum f. sp. albedinis]|nr:Uncharacterized protein HZ326_18789 [Fusarium oxysporum f. sp. albedinis]
MSFSEGRDPKGNRRKRVLRGKVLGRPVDSKTKQEENSKQKSRHQEWLMAGLSSIWGEKKKSSDRARLSPLPGRQGASIIGQS